MVKWSYFRDNSNIDIFASFYTTINYFNLLSQNISTNSYDNDDTNKSLLTYN